MSVSTAGMAAVTPKSTMTDGTTDRDRTSRGKEALLINWASPTMQTLVLVRALANRFQPRRSM